MESVKQLRETLLIQEWNMSNMCLAKMRAFPWCSCVDYSPSSSPYSLSLVSSVATADNVTAVFRVNALPISPSPSICYQTLLINGIEKIEIASQLACLRNVRVLIDGLPSSASGVALPANFRTVANIKVKFSTLVRSSGTTITIIGSGACSSWPALFGGQPQGSFIYSVCFTKCPLHCCLAAGSCSNPQIIDVGLGNSVWVPNVTTCNSANTHECRFFATGADYTYQLAAAAVDRLITVSTCVDNVAAYDTILLAFPSQTSLCPDCPVRLLSVNVDFAIAVSCGTTGSSYRHIGQYTHIH
ncbi:hypothetical protein QJQ45_017239 [Haematococcus lacustris]|nr:hypothetical protein QJQ45_017239 [Haematococcus lacustris]